MKITNTPVYIRMISSSIAGHKSGCVKLSKNATVTLNIKIPDKILL